MAKAMTESAPAGKDQEKVVNIIIPVVSIMRICSLGFPLMKKIPGPRKTTA